MITPAQFVDFGLPLVPCAVCGAEITIERHHMNYSLPMYQGEVVDPDEFDDIWAGQLVCRSCFDDHQQRETKP